MGPINPLHIAFVLAVALLVLGPRRFPEVGRSLGRGLREFKQSIGGHDSDTPVLAEITSNPETDQAQSRADAPARAGE